MADNVRKRPWLLRWLHKKHSVCYKKTKTSHMNHVRFLLSKSTAARGNKFDSWSLCKRRQLPAFRSHNDFHRFEKYTLPCGLDTFDSWRMLLRQHVLNLHEIDPTYSLELIGEIFKLLFDTFKSFMKWRMSCQCMNLFLETVKGIKRNFKTYRSVRSKRSNPWFSRSLKCLMRRQSKRKRNASKSNVLGASRKEVAGHGHTHIHTNIQRIITKQGKIHFALPSTPPHSYAPKQNDPLFACWHQNDPHAPSNV